MGGCFSSEAGEEQAGYGVESQGKMWPSDEDGRWPYVGDRDVDKKASIFIENFHRHQSDACDCADQLAPAAAP